jgi:hypothetical protein
LRVDHGTDFSPAYLWVTDDKVHVHLSPHPFVWRVESIGDAFEGRCHIRAHEVNDGRFLSVTGDGRVVDTYHIDDQSGRQVWQIQQVLDPEASKTHDAMNILSGDSRAGKFLSCTSDGKKVDLFNEDDRSGRQRWVIEELH